MASSRTIAIFPLLLLFVCHTLAQHGGGGGGAVTPGTCPYFESPPKCPEEVENFCTDDIICPPGLKCCNTGCELDCVQPDLPLETPRPAQKTLVSTQEPVTTPKQSQLDPNATSCNINNYNSFSAGPNKKLENLIMDMKRQLDEIQKDLRNLTKTGDNKKGKEKGDNKTEVSKNCAELYKSGKTISGVYTIDPDGSGAFDVFCDQTTVGGGWTVFQKRLDGSVNFYRGWTEYKNGFGNLNGEYWLGLDKINRLTNNERNKLRVDLEDITGKTAHAEYDHFAVTSGEKKYQLRLGTYSGTAGDSLSRHRGLAFSTKDQDNDSSDSRNCAVDYKGAWWYKGCHLANLNGLYHHGQHSSKADGVNWYHWKGYNYSAKRAEMKIRPEKF